MSTSGKKGTGKGPPKKKDKDDDDKGAAASKGSAANADKDTDAKDDSAANNGDKKDSSKGEEASAKPQSAGASTRDAAQKILSLSLKGEWSAVEQNLKSLEKIVSGGGEDVNTVPLAGVIDLVCVFFFFFCIVTLQCFRT